MSYILKYTATKKTWGGSVNAGESFTVVQTSNGPNGNHLVRHLRDLGRTVNSYSSLGGGGLNVGESKTFNEWIIERIK